MFPRKKRLVLYAALTYSFLITEAKYFIALNEIINSLFFRFLEIGERWMQKYFHYLVNARFVVYKVALGQIFNRVLQFSLLSTYFRLHVSLTRRTNR
jgi:hypothetical protein